MCNKSSRKDCIDSTKKSSWKLGTTLKGNKEKKTAAAILCYFLKVPTGRNTSDNEQNIGEKENHWSNNEK